MLGTRQDSLHSQFPWSGFALDDLFGLLSQAILVLVLVLLSLTVARIVKARVARASSLTLRDAAVATLISNLVYVGVILLGVVMALDAVGVQVRAIVTVLGISGLAVSLALQDVLRNFVAGIYILLEKPFDIGDRIALRDVNGDVLGIELRTTLLRTTTGARVIVPNSVVMTEIVTNRSLAGLQTYLVSVAGDGRLLENGLEPFSVLLREQSEVSAAPEPEVYVESLDAGNVTVSLRFWAKRGQATVSDVVRAAQGRFPEAQVSAQAEV